MCQPTNGTSCTQVHGITPSQVSGSPSIAIVLNDFFAWLCKCHGMLLNLRPSGDTRDIFICIVGHNILSCDLGWIWELCQRHHVEIPAFLDCYWDILSYIKAHDSYFSFPLRWAEEHPQDEGINDCSLGSLYRKANGPPGEPVLAIHCCFVALGCRVPEVCQLVCSQNVWCGRSAASRRC